MAYIHLLPLPDPWGDIPSKVDQARILSSIKRKWLPQAATPQIRALKLFDVGEVKVAFDLCILIGVRPVDRI